MTNEGERFYWRLETEAGVHLFSFRGYAGLLEFTRGVFRRDCYLRVEVHGEGTQGRPYTGQIEVFLPESRDPYTHYRYKQTWFSDAPGGEERE